MELMEDKERVIRFGIRVREIDRAYEKFNNQDFDNGVYHKFAYKNQNKKGAGANSNDGNDDDSPDKDENGGRNKPDSSRKIIMARMLKDDKASREMMLTPGSEKYTNISMEVVEKIEQFGFPQQVTINCIKQNLCNHCTTTYYLMQMDQQF